MIRLLAWLDRNWRAVFLALVAAILAVIAVTGCASPAAPHPRPPVPADAEVSDLRRDELAADRAAAEARAKGDTPAADYHARLADEYRRIRALAEQRAIEQRSEIIELATAERARLAHEAEAARLERERAWSRWGIAGCVAAAGLLLLLRLPPILALGAPACLAAGLLVLSGLSSIPWLPLALGGLIVACLALGAAWLVRWLAAEWKRHAEEAQTLGRQVADAASRGRQSRPMRWLVDRLLGP